MSLLRDDRTGAVFSDDREYRYALWRTWDADKPTLGWIMLNPSTADETEDDPTIRRCVGYAEDWGYGTILVGNLFGACATDPDELRDHPDPVGPENDENLRWVVKMSEKVVAAWGTNGGFRNRGYEVMQYLDTELYALGTTKNGQPVHPLRKPAHLKPEPLTVGDEV